MIRSPSREKTKTARRSTSEPQEEALRLAEFRKDRYKRVFDVFVVLASHLAWFPLFLTLWTVIPLAIWLEDRGPVFYTQRGVGKGGRVFKLIKFRSMVVNAESGSGPVWGADRDPRITRVGRFVRDHALDELPQIINVLKGELSLVGPRPERPEFIDQFSEDIPQFVRRLQVRPGLTGLAQVFGRYATRPRDKLRYDMLYIKRVSPWLDCKLLALSVFVTCAGRWQSADKQLRKKTDFSVETKERVERESVRTR